MNLVAKEKQMVDHFSKLTAGTFFFFWGGGGVIKCNKEQSQSCHIDFKQAKPSI